MSGNLKHVQVILKSRFEQRVNFEELERKIYAHDMGVMPSMVKPLVGNPVPDGIVQPISEDELVDIVQLARQHDIKLTPRGRATSGYGGVLPVKGGLVVEFYRMNKIINIDEVNLTATTEPGVVWRELEYHLNGKGLTLALYPTSFPSSTVGGWLAQGGAGIGSYEYGYFRDNVVAARMVQPDGTIRELSGSDLNLISDANGITGLISQVTFSVKPIKPMHVKAIAFDNSSDLAGFMTGLYDQQIPLWSVTFVNPEVARMRNQLPSHLHHGHSVHDDNHVVLPEKFTAVLACTDDHCDLVEQKFMKLIRQYHGEVLSEEIARHEWDARFEPMRAKRIAPSLIPSEVVVPVENLNKVIDEIAKNIDHPFILEGFATNQREFVLLGFILHDERKFNFGIAFGLSLTVLNTAQKYGGRPYATGLYFTGFAEEVLGKERVKALREYKSQYDNGHIMNPGKVFETSLVAAGIGAASKFEPLVRIFGNLAKAKAPGEVFKEKAGIPGDVAWYAYACSQCGYCVDQCAQYSGRGWESQSPRGKWTFMKMVLEGEAEFDANSVANFMSCTTCEMCDNTCQLDLPNESSWFKLRGLLIDERGHHTFPPFEIMVNTLRQQNNIWGSYAKDRDGWMTDEIRSGLKENAEYAFFAGCTTSFVQQDCAQSVALLLKGAGIDYAYLGKDEVCCGIPMLLAGRWEVFDEIAAKNIGNMKKIGVKTVVTACPSCWLTWEIFYRKWAEEHNVDYPIQAKHYAVVLADRINAGELTLKNDVGRKVTYHDSCHMGRAGGIYEEPRTLIKAIPGSNFREMRYNKENTHCCGSVVTLLTDPEVATKIGAVRLQEAVDAGADTIITSCTGCRTQLKIAADAKNIPVEVRDLATLAAEAMGYDIPDSTPLMDGKWGVFEAMIQMLTPWGMADMMADMLPDMIEAMPEAYKGMIRMVMGMPKVARGPIIGMMKAAMPSLFASLLPGMMPKIMPKMLEKVATDIPLPPELLEQMPDLMPKTMEALMPKMLPEILPYFMPKMEAYLNQ